jgi:hypothetical protein
MKKSLADLRTRSSRPPFPAIFIKRLRPAIVVTFTQMAKAVIDVIV